MRQLSVRFYCRTALLPAAGATVINREVPRSQCSMYQAAGGCRRRRAAAAAAAAHPSLRRVPPLPCPQAAMSQVQVNNVPTSASPEELRQLFAQLGPVKSLLMSQEANKAEGTVRGLRATAGRQGGLGHCVSGVRPKLVPLHPTTARPRLPAGSGSLVRMQPPC